MFITRKAFEQLEKRVAVLEAAVRTKAVDPMAHWPRSYLCYACGEISTLGDETSCPRCRHVLRTEKTQACHSERRWYDLASNASERSCLCGRTVIGFPRPRGT